MRERDDRRGDAGVDERREREVERATMLALEQLEHRGIQVRDDANPDLVADLLEAVERFEAAVAARGGDSMVNTIESSEPAQRRFVLPVRRADEGIRSFTARVRQAAQALMGT